MPKKHPEGSGYDFIFFRAQDSRIPDLQHPCLALTIAYAGGPLRSEASLPGRQGWLEKLQKSKIFYFSG